MFIMLGIFFISSSLEKGIEYLYELRNTNKK